MPSHFVRLAATAALAALIPVQAAQAQAQTARSCISREEMRGLVAYLLPTLLDSTISTCKEHLPGDSYLIARAPTLLSRLNEGKDKAWPQAKAGFMKFGGTRASETKLLNAMPDEVIRPFIEAALTAELAPKVKGENCADIDRLTATLEPLPAANVVDMFAEILNLVAREDKKLSSCPAA